MGALVHDGPATPEQISLFLPLTGSLPQTATAAVRYKPTSSSAWTTGHPLYRIQPAFSTVPVVGSVPDAFAWPIIDLVPGTSYDVEVTITSGATTDVRTATFTTRALPAAAGTPTRTVFNGLIAGDDSGSPEHSESRRRSPVPERDLQRQQPPNHAERDCK